MKRVFIMLLLILIPALIIAAPSAALIMDKVIETQKSDTAAMDLKLTLIEANGTERERRIQTLSQTVDDKTSIITVFLSPESVKNTRFLSVEGNDATEQWIYLPALKRVRKISATEEGGSFMGSDFSYSDMASTTYDADEATHRLIEETATTYVVESIPKTVKSYGKNIATVDKETFLPLKVEFYAPDEKTLLKTLTTLETGTVGTRPITKMVEMKTIATGHATRLEMVQVRYDVPIPAAYFTVRFLETGRL